MYFLPAATEVLSKIPRFAQMQEFVEALKRASQAERDLQSSPILPKGSAT
jgi:hypothetical protein